MTGESRYEYEQGLLSPRSERFRTPCANRRLLLVCPADYEGNRMPGTALKTPRRLHSNSIGRRKRALSAQRQRQRQRQPDRDRDRQPDAQTHRHTDTQTARQMGGGVDLEEQRQVAVVAPYATERAEEVVRRIRRGCRRTHGKVHGGNHRSGPFLLQGQRGVQGQVSTAVACVLCVVAWFVWQTLRQVGTGVGANRRHR